MADFGSATINDRTIAESAHGLAEYCKNQSGYDDGRAVVSCDTRNRSMDFARLTATTLAAHGFHVFFFETHRSTPELSFAVRHLKCDIGVMISASHNPPSDNGFKAYWSHGGQVLWPHDEGIIECVYGAQEIPEMDFDHAVSSGYIEIVGDEIDRAYVDAVAALSKSDARNVSALFSPLHGVGETSVAKVLAAAGFADVEIFDLNREPNGDFPNVPGHLPNPERPEVYQPMIDRARDSGAEIILASDPDADRLGIAVRDAEGKFTILSGNQTGVLITDYILNKFDKSAADISDHYVVETLVTTPMISAIAKSHGARAIDDLLVGFKYIGQTMDNEGPDTFLFGAEESLGYLAGTYARDKDAAVAALFMLEYAAELKQGGKTLLDRLDALYCEHGFHIESQRSKACQGPRGKEQVQELLQAFRTAPPTAFSGVPLAQVRDYSSHAVRSLPDNAQILDLPAPSGELLIFDSANVGQSYSIAVRPSGTEPKIKFYFFAQSLCESPDELADVKTQTEGLMLSLQAEFMKWEQSHVFSVAQLDAVEETLNAFDANVRPGTLINVGETIASFASGEVRSSAGESPKAAIDRIGADLKSFRDVNSLAHVVVVNLASTEPPIDEAALAELPSSWNELSAQLETAESSPIPASSLYAIAAMQNDCSFVNFTPSVGSGLPAICELAEQVGSAHVGRDGKTGETLLKSVLAPMFAARNLQVMSWVGHNIFGNMDGKVETARVIAGLRKLEFSIRQIAEILPEHDDEADILDVLVNQQRSMQQKIERFQEIGASLTQIISREREARITMQNASYEVEEKVVDPIKVAGLRMKGRYSDCGQGFSKLGRSFGRYICGKALMLIYDDEYKEDDADFEVCMPVRGGKETDEISLRELPGGRCISLLHKGPYDEISRSYEKILSAVKQRGENVLLPTREVYIKGPGMIFKGNPKKYLTEIQIFVNET
eukprot:g21411.t1